MPEIITISPKVDLPPVLEALAYDGNFDEVYAFTEGKFSHTPSPDDAPDAAQALVTTPTGDLWVDVPAGGYVIKAEDGTLSVAASQEELDARYMKATAKAGRHTKTKGETPTE